MSTHIVSVNIAQPCVLAYKGRKVTTGIQKKPVSDRHIVLGENGFCGDTRADRVNHGGTYKAVYSYASEHYEYWRNRHHLNIAGYGLFGENLTTEGILDKDVCIGDDIAIGNAVLRVTQPRIPCYKLNMVTRRERFNMIFGHSARLGFYMKVISTGFVKNGDKFEIASRDALQISVEDIAKLYFLDRENYSEMARVIKHKALSPDITKVFQQHIA